MNHARLYLTPDVNLFSRTERQTDIQDGRMGGQTGRPVGRKENRQTDMAGRRAGGQEGKQAGSEDCGET